MNKLLQANSITKVYSQNVPLTAIQEVSLSVFEEDYLAIIGPSGAGKSTLLHVLAGLEPPTKGEVLFRDKNLYQMKDGQLSFWRNKCLGFVFQFYHLIEELNVQENIAIAAFRTKRKYALKKAEELLKYLGIAKRIKAFPSQLSGGEKQRVAVARALINNPDIVFCDEPTGNLDQATQERVVELLEKLNQEEKRAVVLVTHNLSLAKKAKRVLFIEDGLIKGG